VYNCGTQSHLGLSSTIWSEGDLYQSSGGNAVRTWCPTAMFQPTSLTWPLLNHFQTGQDPCLSQMRPCRISCLWMWPTADLEPNSHQVFINSIWRCSATQPNLSVVSTTSLGFLFNYITGYAVPFADCNMAFLCGLFQWDGVRGKCLSYQPTNIFESLQCCKLFTVKPDICCGETRSYKCVGVLLTLMLSAYWLVSLSLCLLTRLLKNYLPLSDFHET